MESVRGGGRESIPLVSERRRWTINKLVWKLIRERERESDGGQARKQPGNGKVVISLNGLSVRRLGRRGLTWH